MQNLEGCVPEKLFKKLQEITYKRIAESKYCNIEWLPAWISRKVDK